MRVPLLEFRSLSVGDVVHITTEALSTWLACEPAGWRSIKPPSNLDGAPLNAEKVYQHLRTRWGKR